MLCGGRLIGTVSVFHFCIWGSNPSFLLIKWFSIFPSNPGCVVVGLILPIYDFGCDSSVVPMPIIGRLMLLELCSGGVITLRDDLATLNSNIFAVPCNMSGKICIVLCCCSLGKWLFYSSQIYLTDTVN